VTLPLQQRHIAYRQWTSAADFAEGDFAGTAVSFGSLTIATPTATVAYADPYGDGAAVTYDVATWTSPAVTAGFGCTELVASWNARTPAGTWVEISVRALERDGERPQEYLLGRWAEDTTTIHRTSVPTNGDDLATVAVDTIVARSGRAVSTWRLVVSLHRLAGSIASPRVSLVGAVASRLPDGASPEAVSPSGGAAGRTLDVPTYSQEVHVGEYPQYNGGGEAWCSPTSTAMVLAYWQDVTGDRGHGPSPADLGWVDPSYADPQVDHAAANTFDWNYDGTGNWPFNTAYAGRYGLEAFVTRLRSLTEAETFIQFGIPLVVSVSFRKEELSGAGYSTDGHLLVIVGFTPSGDVVVNDPASHLRPSNADVRTVYDRAEFERLWLSRSGGLAYVIHPPSHPLPPSMSPAEPNW
jgi:Peptidase_C39 like family